MKDIMFDLLTKATFSLGTFHTMLDNTVDPTLIQDIELINKKQFIRRTTGYSVFKAFYTKELTKDNPDKDYKEVCKIIRHIWLEEFDSIMRTKFDDIAKVSNVVVKEADVERTMENKTALTAHGDEKTKKMKIVRRPRSVNTATNVKKAAVKNKRTAEKPTNTKGEK